MKKTSDMTLGEMSIELDKLRNVQANSAPTGPRAVVVVDRGWIFAGDVTVNPNGSLRLVNAVHVNRWEGIGFARMLTEWKSEKVFISGINYPVEVPANSIVFNVPVEANWGQK